jgi:hypothetical protein
MDVTNQDCELACRELLERFFADHPDATAQKRVLRALRFLTADNKLLGGRHSRAHRPFHGPPVD